MNTIGYGVVVVARDVVKYLETDTAITGDFAKCRVFPSKDRAVRAAVKLSPKYVRADTRVFPIRQP